MRARVFVVVRLSRTLAGRNETARFARTRSRTRPKVNRFKTHSNAQTSRHRQVYICTTIAATTVLPDRLALSPTASTSLIAPVFISLGPDGSHQPPPTLVVCYSGAACNLTIFAAMYDTSPGDPLGRTGYCLWGPPAAGGGGGGGGAAAPQCADSVQGGAAAGLVIDATHASARTCGGTLYYGAGPAGRGPLTLNTPRCHAIGQQAATTLPPSPARPAAAISMSTVFRLLFLWTIMVFVWFGNREPDACS